MKVGSLTAMAVSGLRSALFDMEGTREFPEGFVSGGLQRLREDAEDGCHELAEAIVHLVGIAAVTGDLDGFLQAIFLDIDLNPDTSPLVAVRRVLKAHLERTNPE